MPHMHLGTDHGTFHLYRQDCLDIHCGSNTLVCSWGARLHSHGGKSRQPHLQHLYTEHSGHRGPAGTGLLVWVLLPFVSLQIKLSDMFIFSNFFNNTWYLSTATEWVTLISSVTGADRVVVGHPTLSVSTTETRARVPAGLLHAGSGLATLRAHQAFRSAVRWRAYHVSFTGADTHTILLLVLTVCSTWVGITGIKFFHNRHSSWYERALGDGISSVAIQTGADRLVPVSITDGIDTTHSWARINTLVVDTGSVSWTVGVHDTLRSAGQVRVTKVSWDTGTCSCSLP